MAQVLFNDIKCTHHASNVNIVLRDETTIYANMIMLNSITVLKAFTSRESRQRNPIEYLHLADAFIQSDLHCIQVTVFTFDQLLLSLGIEPMILALLAPCSTNTDTVLFLELLYSRIIICLIFEEVCINDSIISLFITLKLLLNSMHCINHYRNKGNKIGPYCMCKEIFFFFEISF